MLDLNFIRQNPELVRDAIKNKGEGVDLDRLLTLDRQRRDLLSTIQDLRSLRKKYSKEIGRLKSHGENTSSVLARMQDVSGQLDRAEMELKSVESEIHELHIRVPNVPAGDVPVGDDDSHNVEVRRWGEPVECDFPLLPHWELGKELDILDFGVASKLAGPNFAFYRGLGAKLERALINFMLDLHTAKHNYIEVFPPFLVKSECMFGTGQLPKLGEDMYRCEEDDLWLIPTAEVPVTNIHRDEIIPAEKLPIYYCAYTPCFRREAGSYGRDTRGLIRVHQFDKVELVKIVRPENSYDELESLLSDAEAVIQALGLHYRVMKLCTGELSFSASKCYDIELWAPGIRRWLEVSSCSNFEDFQARRCGIRFKEPGQKPRYPHTLNGSGVALARLLIAILETYQQRDGSIIIPEVLRAYMGGLERLTKPG